jgi:superfamily II DNA or RNA helicase
MSSFLSVSVPTKISGTPCALAQGTLGTLFQNSTSVILTLSGIEIEGLARLTWGLSRCNLEHCTFTLHVFESEQDQPGVPENLAAAHLRTRIGWLRYLLEAGKLRIEGLRSNHPVPAHVRFIDSASIEVAALVKAEASVEVETEHYTASLIWPFGDPAGRYDRLRDAAAKASPAPTAAERIRGYINAVPTINPPFEEAFDENSTELIPGVDLFPHQSTAIENWEERGWKGIFAMCTGSGKTIAALAGVMKLCRELCISGKPVPPIVIAVPKKILGDQWIWVIEELFQQAALKAYGSHTEWRHLIAPYLAPNNEGLPRFIVTTYATFGAENFQRAVRAFGNLGHSGMFIADEMHNLSSKRLRVALSECDGYFPFRLGLSATPEIEGDEHATNFLCGFFGEEKRNYCGKYTLRDGICAGVLCKYKYYPLPTFLDHESGKRYLEILQNLDVAGFAKNSPEAIQLFNQRRDILQKSVLPLEKLDSLIKSRTDAGKAVNRMLVYCPPGNVLESDDTDDSDAEPSLVNLLQRTTEIIAERGLTVTAIVGQTPEKRRRENLSKFKNGDFDCLCAIGCLDEGVDVPAIERAVVLYSIDREKQFIQRRGRILRRDKTNPEKIAEIFDVVLLPPKELMETSHAKQLLQKEMRRYYEFMELAENANEAEMVINAALDI